LRSGLEGEDEDIPEGVTVEDVHGLLLDSEPGERVALVLVPILAVVVVDVTGKVDDIPVETTSLGVGLGSGTVQEEELRSLGEKSQQLRVLLQENHQMTHVCEGVDRASSAVHTAVKDFSNRLVTVALEVDVGIAASIPDGSLGARENVLL